MRLEETKGICFIANKPAFKLAAYGVKQGGIGSLLAGGFPTLKKTGAAKKPPVPESVSIGLGVSDDILICMESNCSLLEDHKPYCRCTCTCTCTSA